MSTTAFKSKEASAPQCKGHSYIQKSAKWRESCFYRMFHSSPSLVSWLSPSAVPAPSLALPGPFAVEVMQVMVCFWK